MRGAVRHRPAPSLSSAPRLRQTRVRAPCVRGGRAESRALRTEATSRATRCECSPAIWTSWLSGIGWELLEDVASDAPRIRRRLIYRDFAVPGAGGSP